MAPRIVLSDSWKLNDTVIERTFHPVGQGGFYTEVIQRYWCSSEEFVVVYDCGTLSAKATAMGVIDQFFTLRKVKKIDLLIISHFDADHVNLIPYLFDQGIQVSKVLVPYISKEEFRLTFLFCATQESEEDRKVAINVLTGVFPEYAKELDVLDEGNIFADTTVLYVDSITTDNGDFEPEEQVDIDELTESFSKIGGKRKLSTKYAPKWFLLPRNYDFENQRENLELALFNAGMSYTELSCVKKLRDSSSLNLIRRIYKDLEGTVNQTSLLVLTGVWSAERTVRAGCLLSGDFPTDKVEVRSLFPVNSCENLELVQVPHHGSSAHFDIHNFLPNRIDAIAVVHAGHTNRYDHPRTKTLVEVSKRVAGTLIVTEKSLLTTFMLTLANS